MEQVITRYPIWIDQLKFDALEQAWQDATAQLQELGVVRGWVQRSHAQPHYACLMWQDKEYWETFNQFGLNPLHVIKETIGSDVLLGYLDPEIRKLNEGLGKSSLHLV